MLSFRRIFPMKHMNYRMFSIIRKYTKTNEWIEYDTEKSTGILGITNHAQ